MTSWGIARNQLATMRWSAYSGNEMRGRVIPILGELLPGPSRPRRNSVRKHIVSSGSDRFHDQEHLRGTRSIGIPLSP